MPSVTSMQMCLWAWTVEEAVDMPKTLEEELAEHYPKGRQKPQPDPEKMVDKPKKEPKKAGQELKKESVEESDDASSMQTCSRKRLTNYGVDQSTPSIRRNICHRLQQFKHW